MILELLTVIPAVVIPNPDVSGGLPPWLNPVNNITNLSAVVVLRLAGLGIVLAAGLLALGFLFNIRATKVIAGILGAVVAVMLVLNGGTVLSYLSGTA